MTWEIPQIKIPKVKDWIGKPMLLAHCLPRGEGKDNLMIWDYIEKALDMPYKKKHKISKNRMGRSI